MKRGRKSRNKSKKSTNLKKGQNSAHSLEEKPSKNELSSITLPKPALVRAASLSSMEEKKKTDDRKSMKNCHIWRNTFHPVSHSQFVNTPDSPRLTPQRSKPARKGSLRESILRPDFHFDKTKNSIPQTDPQGERHRNDEGSFKAIKIKEEEEEEENKPLLSKDRSPPPSFINSLKSELGMSSVTTEPDQFGVQGVKEYLWDVLIEMEKLIAFGWLTCLDTMLYFFTFFPIRCLIAICCFFRNLIYFKSFGNLLTRSQLYDLLQAAFIVICCTVLQNIQLGIVYHYIRGETFIKLYLVFNLLEILDRLLCALGQDVMHSLSPTAKRADSTLGLIGRPIFACVLMIIHTCLIFVRLVVLNVACNSSTSTRLHILISNNFVEIKSTVFKRFYPESIFQMSCSDVVEIFTTTLFLFLIFIQELPLTWDYAWGFGGITIIVLLGEIAIDWLKHAFISKFNGMSHTNYQIYSAIIAHDVLNKTQESVDPTHILSHRLGLSCIPLFCTTIRFLFLAAFPRGLEISPKFFIFIGVVFAIALVMKIIVSYIVYWIAVRKNEKYGDRISSQWEKRASPKPKELKKQTLEALPTVNRYTLATNRIP